MTYQPYRYRFQPDASLEDVEASLLLALWGTEALHGSAAVELDAAYFLDRDRRQCVVDAASDVGQTLNQLFVGFLRREFPVGTFRVERIDETQPAASEGVPA